MATLLRIMILISILASFSTVAAGTSFSDSESAFSTLSPSPASSPMTLLQENTLPMSLFGPILADLGFADFAAAAPSLSTSTVWRGPITVFAATDSSVLTCPSCSVPLLLQEHTVPGLFPIHYLSTLAFGTKIETLAPGRCLTITSTNNSSRIFVGGVEVTHPDLFNNGLVVVHGLQGYVSHLSPFSCSIERMTSLTFLPPPPQAEAFVMRLMLRDAMLRLRISGYTVLAIALKVKYAELMDFSSFTVFALDDPSVFSSGQSFVTDFRFHVVPNRLLLAEELEHLPAGTILPTMHNGHNLMVTTNGGIQHTPMRINYVQMARLDLLYNLKIAVHGITAPFPNVNLTAALEVIQLGHPGSQHASISSQKNQQSSSMNSRMQWSMENDHHHGL
ncbi:fasciclin-like arabinogalactan protein 21 [Impatiens glandulifera]|uniref:fasciclin-like arabinogalactan protein 21 n=1 Tax=Impatiens glandulifera TaxID=253017 RepID=UPI001FB13606|nr:fasciclin-like arabinogalactan protein 21 [Impatiens glandulifera]